MSVIIILGALALLIGTAYFGFSVILMAPIAALLAILLTDPAQFGPAFSGVFMESMAGFIRTYFPVFMLGAIFGKPPRSLDSPPPSPPWWSGSWAVSARSWQPF